MNLFGEKYVYIDRGPAVFVRDEARERLRENTDAKFFDPELGVAIVPEERWRIAQEAEHSHWFDSTGSPKKKADDRNLDHFRNFNLYRSIRGMKFRRALEVGSGPFTNLRLISRVCGIGSVSLLDPLADRYRFHSGSYVLSDRLTSVPAWKWLPQFWKSASRPLKLGLAKILGSIPVEEVYKLEGEDDSDLGTFDLVVVINVLEHCRDARSVLENAINRLEEGGILIFSDKLYPLAGISEGLRRIYDVAHPVRISAEWVRSVLLQHEVLYQHDLVDPASSFFAGATESYFIVRKR